MKRIIILLSAVPLILTGCGKLPNSITFYKNDDDFETLYDDSYFLLDNKEYHQEISLVSFANAMASINNNEDYSLRSNGLVDIWNKEKFTNIYINDDYKVKPTLDSIGFGIASKKIEDFNLITVTIRSGGYDAEWANNLTGGYSGNALGFQNSADIVLDGLNEYINSNNFYGHTKFWLNGYSRGGAVTNLLSAMVLKQIKEGSFNNHISTTIDDLYAYCFEPLSCVEVSFEEAKNDLYKGIHNVMNFNDIIAKLYPKNWGIIKYGQNHYFSDRLLDINFDKSERKKMVMNYHFGKNAYRYPDYSIDDWKFYSSINEFTKAYNLPIDSIHPSLGRFADNLVDCFTRGNVERSVYADAEDGIRNIVATVFGYNPDIEGIKISQSAFFDILFTYSFIQTLFLDLEELDYGGFASDLESIFYILFNANKDNYEAIQKLYNDVYYFILLNIPYITYRPDILHQLFSRDNLLILASAHANELNYSFLRSSDTRLYGEKACKLNDGNYYILRIKTPSSIAIYEKTLRKDIFSYSNGVMSSDTLSAEKMYDGSVDIYMPKNGHYQYHIESTDICLINVDDYNNESIIHDRLPKTGMIN